MIDDALKAEVVKWSAFYEHRIRLGTVNQRVSISIVAYLGTDESPSRRR